MPMLIDPPISDPDSDPVQNTSETRFANGAATRETIIRVIREDGPRGRMRALVKGLIDGNPPYNEAKRVANKLQWTANLNFLQGQAMMDSTAVPYYSIFNGVTNYAECRTAHQPDNPQHEYWCERISLRFHQMLRRWTQYDWHIQQISYWMRLHGIGPVFWENDGDWRFRSMDTGSLLCPQQSPSVIDKRIPFLILRVQYRIHELFEKIQDEKAAKAVGWNVEYVKNVIRYACRGMSSGAQWWANPWEFYQTRLKNNDLYASFSTSDIVFCSYAFVLEKNGKITKSLSVEGGIPAPAAEPSPDHTDKDYLLYQASKYNSYAECVQAFFLNANDGQWHSVRGYGTAGFKYFELSNRILCRAADGVFIKGSLVLQSGSAKNSDKLQLTQHGPVTWLPAGAELVQVQMQGATDELLAFHRVLNNQFSSNMGVNTGQPLSRTDGRGEVPTAEQIRAQVTQDATISQGQMTLFYLQLDDLDSETYRRASDPNTSDEEAKRFQRECIEDGVPKEALTDMEYVRANRASGFGSQQARKQANQELLQIIGMLPEDGRQNAVQDIVVGIMGPEKLKRYVPDQHVPNNDDWQANEENGSMEDGHAPILAAGQSDVVHLHSHLQAGANKLQPAQEAEDSGQKLPPEELQKLYGYVQILVHHCEEHLARLQRDPSRKGLVAMFQKQIEHMVGWSGKLRGAYIRAVKDQQLAAAQEQQAGVMGALDRAKLQSQQVDNLTKASKTAAGIRTNDAKALNAMRIKTIQAAQDMVLKKQKQEAELAHAESGSE